MESEVQRRAEPSLIRWGQRLIWISILCLVVGGITVRVFFPQLAGRGLDAVALSILLPIWAIGIAGILLLLLGWICHPALDSDLHAIHSEADPRPDQPIFGRLTKSLALLTAGIAWLSSLALVLSPDEPIRYQ